MDTPDIQEGQRFGDEFYHDNDRLYIALLCAGHLPFRVINEYTGEILDSLKCGTMLDARRMKRRGKVRYSYKNSVELDALVKAYDDQLDAEKTGREVFLPNITPEEAVRVNCRALHHVTKCRDMLFSGGVMMFRKDKGKTTTEKEEKDGVMVSATINGPGFTLASLNLSPAKRAALEK